MGGILAISLSLIILNGYYNVHLRVFTWLLPLCVSQDGREPRDLSTSLEVRQALDDAILRQRWTGPRLPLDRVPLYLCGNGEVGKSTFAQALQKMSLKHLFWDLPKMQNARTHG